MIDETSDIARTDTVEYWETCAKEAGSKNGDLQFALDHWIAVANVVKKQRDQAEKERDALRKDAARLDWLESRKSYSISNLGGMSCAHLWVTDGEDVRVTKTVTKPTLREAIDAAMEAK